MILAQGWSMSLSVAMLFAVVATLGYLFGRRRPESAARTRAHARHEVMRALAVAQELETIAYRLRRSMAFHLPAIVRFNHRLHRWDRKSDVSWHELCDQADEMLKPTLRLSTEISHAYADLVQQMTHLSTFAELGTDPLTGVHNRRAFDESLDKMLAEHERGELPLSIAMLDLDHFKQVNDEQGHLTGDRVLQDLAQLITESLGTEDVLARFGGEEFTILMPDSPPRAACDLSERIRARVEEKLPTTVSIGVATAAAGEPATAVLSRVDAALYTAKNEGRNRVCFYDGCEHRIVTPRQPGIAPADEPFVAGPVAPPVGIVGPPIAGVPPISSYQGDAC